MHVKYALLHCSYSAPVWVLDITVDTPSIAARDTVVALLRPDVFVAMFRTVDAARDTDASLRVICCGGCCDGRAVVLRATVVLRDVDTGFVVAARDTVVVPELRVVTLRPVMARVDAVRATVAPEEFCVAPDSRFVAFSSRTAASAMPMHTAHILKKARIFFISD